nr:MAG TPA: RNHCP domain protein [Caudoviricetes sp.]
MDNGVLKEDDTPIKRLYRNHCLHCFSGGDFRA